MSKHVSHYAQWQKRIASTYQLMHDDMLATPLADEDVVAVRRVLDADPEEIRMACWRLGMNERQLEDRGLLEDVDSVLEEWRELLPPRAEDIGCKVAGMGYQVSNDPTVFSKAYGYPYLDDADSWRNGVKVTDGGDFTVYWWFDTEDGYLHRREEHGMEEAIDVSGMPTWLAARFVLYGNPTVDDIDKECAKLGVQMPIRYAFVGTTLQVSRLDDLSNEHWLMTAGMTAREVAQWIMTGEEPSWRHTL